jgi:hypothetical protein
MLLDRQIAIFMALDQKAHAYPYDLGTQTHFALFFPSAASPFADGASIPIWDRYPSAVFDYLMT